MNLLLLYRIKCLPKNTNGRLAIPALAGLLVLGLLQWTMWHVAGWMRPLGDPLKIGAPRLQPCQPSGKSGPDADIFCYLCVFNVNFVVIQNISASFSELFPNYVPLCLEKWGVMTPPCSSYGNAAPGNTNRKPYSRNSMVQLSTPWGDP